MVLVKPGMCCTTSGEKDALPRSNANSRATMLFRTDEVFMRENKTSAPMLSDLIANSTLVCCQCLDHKRNATKPANDSKICCDSEFPI